MKLDTDGQNAMASAKLGYEAYSEYTGGRSAVTGDPLPQWHDLTPAIRNAWFAAASAILDMDNNGRPVTTHRSGGGRWVVGNK